MTNAHVATHCEGVGDGSVMQLVGRFHYLCPPSSKQRVPPTSASRLFIRSLPIRMSCLACVPHRHARSCSIVVPTIVLPSPPLRSSTPLLTRKDSTSQRFACAIYLGGERAVRLTQRTAVPPFARARCGSACWCSGPSWVRFLPEGYLRAQKLASRWADDRPRFLFVDRVD